MEFPEILRKRKMVRKYLSRPVDPEQLDRIVAAALRAPTAGFSQGQSFVVVTGDEKRRALAEICGEAAHTKRGFEPWFSSAPAHIVCCISEREYRFRYQQPDKKSSTPATENWPVPWWFVDAGCSMALLLLGAVNEGLGAGFSGFRTASVDAVRDLLFIPPEVLPFGLVTVGHPAPDRPSGSVARGRKGFDKLVHHERWQVSAPLSPPSPAGQSNRGWPVRRR